MAMLCNTTRMCKATRSEVWGHAQGRQLCNIYMARSDMKPTLMENTGAFWSCSMTARSRDLLLQAGKSTWLSAGAHDELVVAVHQLEVLVDTAAQLPPPLCQQAHKHCGARNKLCHEECCCHHRLRVGRACKGIAKGAGTSCTCRHPHADSWRAGTLPHSHPQEARCSTYARCRAMPGWGPGASLHMRVAVLSTYVAQCV